MKTIKVQLNDIRPKSQWEGKEPVNNSPILDWCRKLIKDGEDPETKLEVYREGKTEPDFIVKNIGEGAKFAVRENNEKGPHFIKYVPIDAKSLARLNKKRQSLG